MGVPLYLVSVFAKCVYCNARFGIEQHRMCYVKDKVILSRFSFTDWNNNKNNIKKKKKKKKKKNSSKKKKKKKKKKSNNK